MSHRQRNLKDVRSQIKHRISPLRKLLFAVLTTLAVFGSLEFALWLLRVEPAFLREDPYAGFSRHIPHFAAAEDIHGQTRLTVSPNKVRVLNPQEFIADKPPHTYRIVCLGGSTTYGRPFFDLTSFPGWLRELLPAAQPSRRWEVINAGGISYASYRALGMMEELTRYSPDLFVVYTGQNEFLERRTYEGLASSPSVFSGPLSLLYRTRSATLIRDVLDAAGTRRIRSAHRAPVLGEETKAIPVNAVGPAAYRRDEALSSEIIDHFRATLNRMIQVAQSAKADILFVVPASNVADFAPFKSQHRAGLNEADLTSWSHHETRARALISQGRFVDAMTEIEQAQTLDDRYAALWYLKGQSLKALGRFDEAKQALKRARDEDVCPLRAIEPLLSVVRSLPEATGESVVDFEQLAEQNSENNLPGVALFHDHVHPTIDANRMLALAIIDELMRRKIVRPASTWSPEAIRRVSEDIENRIDRPLHARQLRQLAAMMAWLNQPGPARIQSELSLELSGRTEQALLELAAGLQSGGSAELAMEYLRTAVEVAPESAQAHFRLAVSELDADQDELAIPHLQTAIQLDPDFAEARVRLGVALASEGQLQQAEKHLAAAVRLDPDSGSVRNNLGLVIARQGRFHEAVAVYQKSLSLDNMNSSTHYNSGLAYEQLGELEKARSHFETAIRLSNGHPAAQARLHALLNRPTLREQRQSNK